MTLSIIVPVFKVESYLRRCIESILAQTFTDFELILVDDGSPDGCPAICDEYARLDNRVHVIHKPNGGISDARNAGLEIAQGEYIGFVDSDDYIHPQMYELLHRAVCGYQADIATVDFDWVTDNLGDFAVIDSQDALEKAVVYHGTEYLDHFYPQNRYILRPEVWNKLYRRQIFSSVYFPVGRAYEDAFLQLSILEKATKVVKIPAVCYFYWQREGSVMHSDFVFQRVDDMVAVCEKNVRYYRERRNQEQVEYALEDYLNMFCRDKMAVYFCYPEFRKPFCRYEKQFNKEFWRMIFATHICRMKKVMLVFLRIYPPVALRICRKYFKECLHKFMR